MTKRELEKKLKEAQQDLRYERMHVLECWRVLGEDKEAMPTVALSSTIESVVVALIRQITLAQNKADRAVAEAKQSSDRAFAAVNSRDADRKRYADLENAARACCRIWTDPKPDDVRGHEYIRLNDAVAAIDSVRVKEKLGKEKP